MPLIDLEGIEHTYGAGASARTVLRDLDLHLKERRIGVIGGNGSGKSTFARLLNGLLLPTRGVVRVDELDTRHDARAIRRRVGFCFTDPDAQIVMPTVAEDIAFGLRHRGLSRAEVGLRVEAALDRFGLAAHRDHPAHLLSGGQKQLLALAAVLVTGPQLLVMDEPTTLLDLANTRRIGDVLATLPEQVLLLTHHLDLVADFDRVLVFDGGRVVHDGTPTESVAFYRKLLG